jgi:hypothetical protein
MGPVNRLCAELWDAREGFLLEPSVARALASHFEGLGDSDKAAYFTELAERVG